jgi:hypothetical protein
MVQSIDLKDCVELGRSSLRHGDCRDEFVRCSLLGVKGAVSDSLYQLLIRRRLLKCLVRARRECVLCSHAATAICSLVSSTSPAHRLLAIVHFLPSSTSSIFQLE